MLAALFDSIHAHLIFKDIDMRLREQFPSVHFPEPIIKKRADGTYKEFDCAAKKKFEDMKKSTVLSDVWNPEMNDRDRNNSYKFYGGGGVRDSIFDAKRNATLFDATLCPDTTCAHEKAFHDTFGKCNICKRPCDGWNL
jgi:hypothetical protein